MHILTPKSLRAIRAEPVYDMRVYPLLIMRGLPYYGMSVATNLKKLLFNVP
jgi:hypothetical protein